MEPIHPELRNELKRAHPELTDADIDRYEELTSLRFTLDPSADRDQIRRIDSERTGIVQSKMPQLGELENAFNARIRSARREPPPSPPRVEFKTEPGEPGGP